MSYTTYDFTESLNRAESEFGFGLADVSHVIAAWGGSSEGGGSWEGGFVLSLKDGRYAYLTGWCDYTGWGCQDGIDCQFFEVTPDWRSIKDVREGNDYEGEPYGWDESPADLNLLLKEHPHDDSV